MSIVRTGYPHQECGSKDFRLNGGNSPKALTLWQPWASLIALHLKQYETRSWGTNYRGKLLIHAANRKLKSHEVLEIKRQSNHDFKLCRSLEGKDNFPLSCIVAIADLTQCSEMTWLPAVNPPWYQVNIGDQTQLEQAVGIWEPGRYAWKLENVIALRNPVPCKGGQRLWNPSQDVLEQVIAEVAS